MSSRKITFKLTPVDSTEIHAVHTIGELTKPAKWELKKVIYLIVADYPDCVQAKLMLSAMDSYYREDDDTFNEVVAPYFPYLLSFFRDRKLSQKDRVCLWIIGCYYYHFCGGPKPATITERATHKPVKTDGWRQELFCPVCRVAAPKKVVDTKDRKEALILFGQWMSKHAVKCGKSLQSLKLREQELAKKDYKEKLEQGYQRIERTYLEAKAMEPEVKAALRKAWLQNDKLTAERQQVKALQVMQDDSDFENAVKRARIARKKGLEPLSPKDISRYVQLTREIQHVEELLTEIKGQRGVTAQRELLQKSLKVRQDEYQALEERRIFAGEQK